MPSSGVESVLPISLDTSETSESTFVLPWSDDPPLFEPERFSWAFSQVL